MRRNSSFILAALTVVATAVPAAVANTINVPADYSTIQAAINAASSGDTINVAAGVYKENINFGTKNLTVIGSGNGFISTIDGQKLGSTVTIAGGQNSTTVLQNFSIIHGSGTKVSGVWVGGGVYIDKASSPTILDNGIGFNNVQNQGGGVYVGVNCKPTFSGNLITNNFTTSPKGAGGGMYVAGQMAFDSNRVAENGAPSGTGGGIYLIGVNSTVTNNTITQNFAFYGGGVQVFKGSPVITGNLFDRNTVLSAPNNGEGAGIGITGKATPTVSGNEFQLNTAHNGGGIYAYDSSPIISNNLIHDNQANLGIGFGGGVSFGKTGGSLSLNQIYLNAANQGGGISARTGATTTMYGNLVDTNTAAGSNGFGGGLYSLDSAPPIIAGTFAVNTAAVGGGVYYKGNAASAIDTTIIWGNVGTTSDPSFFDATSLLSFTFSDVEGPPVGGSSLALDPLFVNAGARNFSLSTTSPLIDAGNPGTNPGGNDLAGNPRVVGSAIDMGALEF